MRLLKRILKTGRNQCMSTKTAGLAGMSLHPPSTSLFIILAIRAQTVQSRLTDGDIPHSHVHPEEKNPVCHELLENLWPSGGRFGAKLANPFLRIKTNLRRKKDLKQNYVFTHFLPKYLPW